MRKILDEDILAAFKQYGSRAKASNSLGMDRRNFTRRLNKIQKQNIEHETKLQFIEEKYLREISILRAKLNEAEKEKLDEERVKTELLKLRQCKIQEPNWVIHRDLTPAKSPGTPTLFLSDWHIGEIVDPKAIRHANEFNLEIAEERVRTCVERTINILTRHVVTPKFPGIVILLGGDMVSGNIHEELISSNEVEIMGQVEKAIAFLLKAIKDLVDVFGKAYIVGVSGNHSRVTRKIYSKRRVHTSFDWLIYRMLQMLLEDDKRIKWNISDGGDVSFRIYNHTYSLEHGDEYSGGDGMIGPLGPLMRGDWKKRGRDMQIEQPYDTLLVGHFHQLMILNKLIVNGSLKGYDEYAYGKKLSFEIPQQALWITHPEHGITLSMPVRLSEKLDYLKESSWVSWEE